MKDKSNHYLSPDSSSFWIVRVFNFSKQMFPLYPNIIIIFGQFFLNFFVLQSVFELSPSFNVFLATLGAISNVLFLYLFRVFDEIKDYPTDKINFPDRPLVRGVMNIPDTHKLWFVVSLVLIALQFVIGIKSVWITFALVMSYSFLAFKWFFAEEKIRPNLPLALYTHNPIMYLFQVYLLSFFGAFEGNFSLQALIFLFGDAMAGTAWEISRKIRGKNEEDTYVTYSQVWGRKKSLTVVGAILLCSFLLTLVTVLYQTQNVFFALFWIPPFIAFMYFVSQARNFLKTEMNAPNFRSMVEIFKFCILASFLLSCLFVKYSN